MQRTVIETTKFSKVIDEFQKKRQLLKSDYESFKTELAINPEKGNIITGTGGIRKIRLSSNFKR